MKRDMLSPEEREEYDVLLAEAGYDDTGERRPSNEIGERMHLLLEDADQAGRGWATAVIRGDAVDGHLMRFKRWDKARNRQKIFVGGVIVPRAAVVGVRKQRSDGSEYWQQGLWRELTWEEVEQKVTEARSQVRSGQITVATAQKLLKLRERAPNTIGPFAACVLLGLDFDEYLAQEDDVA